VKKKRKSYLLANWNVFLVEKLSAISCKELR
jgi:hypothetical protein